MTSAKNSTKSVYKHVAGIPKAVLTEKTQDGTTIAVDNCYIQNAAIGWKQPNGFYYPPTFHSSNLFFDNVDIRHYVIVPQFAGNTYKTDAGQVAKRYCAPPRDALFNNYSAIDRQTILTDDDGSLTGYKNTISINTDNFFRAPIEGIECQSDGAVPEGGTARTSPYAMVTTVVYPDDAQFAQPPGKFQRVCWKDPKPEGSEAGRVRTRIRIGTPSAAMRAVLAFHSTACIRQGQERWKGSAESRNFILRSFLGLYQE